MRLIKLDVRRMPGIDEGFRVENLDPGVNLVVGPNGSGKTTLCRAVRALLWPEADTLDTVALLARWQAVDGVWSVRREGKRVSWQRDGIDVEPPPLPDERGARCFLLGMRDLLLDSDGSDLGIAEEIRRQMAGGYDVHEVLRSHFTLGRRHGHREESRLRGRREHVERLRAEQTRLAGHEDRLRQLEQRKERAREALAELDALRRARELGQARAKLAALEETVKSLPAALDRLRGDELARLDELRGEHIEIEQRIDDARRRADEASRQLAGAGVADPDAVDARLNAWQTRVNALQTLESELHDAAAEEAAAAARVDEATRALGADASPVEEPRREDLRSLESLIEERMILERERTALAAERALLDGPAPARSSDELGRAVRSLRELRAVTAGGRWRLLLGGMVGAVLVAAGGLIVWRAQPAGWLGVAAGAGWLAQWLVVVLGAQQTRRAARRELLALAVDPPQDRTVGALEARLRAVELAWEEALHAEQRLARRQALDARALQLDERARGLADRRAACCARLGLPSASGDLELTVLARGWVALREAAADHAAARARLQAGRQRYATALGALVEFFGQPAVITDAAEAAAALDDLRTRCRRALHARDALQREEQSQRELRGRLDGYERKIRELFAGADVPAGDDAELGRRLQQLENYRSTTAQMQQCRHLVLEHERRLGQHAELLHLAAEDLDRRLADAEQRAAGLAELAERIGSIRRAVESARRGEALEAALAEWTRAEQDLVERREAALHVAAGRFMLEQVRAEYDEQSRPEVLRRAAGLFRRFTHHRYDLSVDTGVDPPVLRALDTGSGRGLSLAQLSDGTRLQLLLAARLAFAGHLDPRGTVPLLLDEVLTTSDPERFRAVAECLLVIARDEGRQVFYLTSNPDDTRRWDEVAAAVGDQRPRPVDLARLRGLGAPDGRLPTALRPASARSEDRPHAPRVELNPREPGSAMHLFYVLEDEPELLRRLMGRRIESVGQAESFVASGEARHWLAASDIERLEARLEIARAFAEASRIGRGKRLDAQALKRAGVSEVYLPRLAELCDELRGDARQLLTCLERRQDPRTRFFRERQRAELAERLRAAEYLDERPTLDERAVAEHVRSAVAGSVRARRISAQRVDRLIERLHAATRRFEHAGH